jgi:hypothetical protein
MTQILNSKLIVLLFVLQMAFSLAGPGLRCDGTVVNVLVIEY